MTAAHRLVLALVLLPVAANAIAEPMTEIVQFDGADVVVSGDFNADSRLDLLTLEPEGPSFRFGLYDGLTGVRWARTPGNINAMDALQGMNIVDLDDDGLYELIFHDVGFGGVRSIEIPPAPGVPPTPDAVMLTPQWTFSYPTDAGGPPFEPFQPAFASFDGVHLQFVFRDNGFGPAAGYRVRDHTGTLIQSIADEVPPSRLDIVDVENDGRLELAIVPASTIGSLDPKRVRIYQWTGPITAVGGTVASRPSLRLMSANPARTMASFRYSVPSTSDVEMLVHDVQGRTVRTLVRGRAAAGAHEARWSGEDDDGRMVPSGAYFVRYDVGGTRLGRKIVWMR